MGIDDTGDHSQNSNSDGERPFKKAKYAWQVKGRSHLKDNNNKPQPDSSTSEKESKIPTNQKDSRPCQGCVYLNKILNHSENLMASDDDNDEDDDETPKSRFFQRSRNSHVPISMVPKFQKNYDHYLSKWQARQVAKSFVDNTINGALEKWMIAPFFDDANDFIENCENGGLVEDEGILMAIQSHGLQSQQSSSLRPPLNLNRDNIDVDITSSDSNETLTSTELSECTCKTKLKAHNVKTTSDQVDPADIPSPSHQTVEPATNNNSNATNFEHFDFLSTAVAVAIQKKGLNI